MLVRQNIIIVDPTVDLQAAITAVPVTGAVIELGPGTYNITGTLTFPTDRGVWLKGAGSGVPGSPYGSIIHNLDATGNTDWVRLQGDTQKITDCFFTGANTAAGTGRGIVIGQSTSAILREIALEHIWLQGVPSWGIDILGVETNTNPGLICSEFRDVCVNGGYSNAALVIESGATTLLFDSCKFTNQTGNGAVIYSIDGCTFHHCTWDTISALHVEIVGRNFVPLHALRFLNCYFEQPDNSGAYFITLDTFVQIGVEIISCQFERSHELVQSVKAVSIAASASAVIYGCRVINPIGYCKEPYLGNADIIVNSTGAAYGTVIEGGYVHSFDGVSTTHYEKMRVTDNGNGTLLAQPTVSSEPTSGNVVGRYKVPAATKTQLVAQSTAGSVEGQIAYDTTDHQYVIGDNTGWRPLTMGTVLS